MNATEQITMDEVATPAGIEEQVQMNRQTNVVNGMR